MSLADLYVPSSVAPTATSQPASSADPSALIADAPSILPITPLPPASAPDRQAAYRMIDHLMRFCGVEEIGDLPS